MTRPQAFEVSIAACHKSSVLTCHAIPSGSGHAAKSSSVLRLYHSRHAVERRLDKLDWSCGYHEIMMASIESAQK